MSFFKIFTGVSKQKVKQAGEGMARAIVEWDPAAASEAQIEMMSEKFEELSLKVEKARQEHKVEQKEADEAVANYDLRKKAALSLQADLQKAEGDAKVQLEAALTELITDLEDLKPEVETEKTEAVDALAWLNDLEKDLKIFSDKMKTARKDTNKASKNMERAKRQQGKAEEKAAQANERAGISKQADAFDSVLSVMNDNAARAQAAADAATNRASLMSKTSATDNDLVAKAMAKASGQAAENKKTTADRLSSL